MKRILGFLFVLLILCFSAFAASVQMNYVPGNIWVTSASDTTTAGGGTYLRGSAQPQTDIEGNKFASTAFQIQAVDNATNLNSVDFLYAYSAGATIKNLWKGSWGPMQRTMSMPAGGVYVSPTFTASGTIILTFETIQ